MTHYQAIVLGVGGVGSAALYHLARRGVRVLGLDRFPPGHDRGSSHGATRIIREAYFEHPDYVPLIQRSFQLWDDLERRREERLYQQVGLLQVGSPDGAVVRGVLASAERHRLNVDALSAEAAGRRFPGFRIPPEMTALYEHRAGYLRVEACVRAHADEAVRAGAELRVGESIKSWRRQGDSMVVETTGGSVTAERLVIAGGAWNRELLAELGLRLPVRRKVQYWFRAQTPVYAAASGCPAYLFETPQGMFYGFPQLDETGVKVAEHTGGAEVPVPLELDRELDPAERRRVESFCQQHLPELSTQLTRHAPCMYTMSPDEHFIVDRHPTMPHVVFAAGLSGHGFKFAAVLGELLCQLVLDGATTLPIGFLSLSRPGLASAVTSPGLS